MSAAHLQPPAIAGAAQPPSPSPDVLRVVGHDCRGRDFVRSGFRARGDGQTGIVTVLHAVVGCRTVSAEGGGGTFQDLVVVRVDVARDLALLANDRLAGMPGLVADAPERGGPAVGGTAILSERLTLGQRSLVADRRSPRLDVRVGPAGEPPDQVAAPRFGAPALARSGDVVGVLDGVVAGAAPAVWIVPWSDVEWTPPVQNETEMDRLAGLSSPLW